jgi:hypothetical protein
VAQAYCPLHANCVAESLLDKLEFGIGKRPRPVAALSGLIGRPADLLN